MVQYDKKRFWKFLFIWIIGVCVSFPSSFLVNRLFKGIIANEGLVLTLWIGVLFLPFVVTGIYGLVNGYSLSERINYIWRGRRAIALNIFIIVLYFLILGFFAIYPYEQMQ